MTKKKTTIYTLSKELNLSPATISKALSNSPEVKPDTAAMIRKRAKECGFRPRATAPRTHNICALIQTELPTSSCFSPYTVGVMQGMMSYLQQNEMEFSLYSDTFSKLNSGLLLRYLGRRNINGAVLINTNEDSIFYDELDKNNFPYCSLFSNPGKDSSRLLTVDNTDIAFRAIDYLIQIGHRKIATIATPAHGSTGRDRLAGYVKALKQANIPVDPTLIIRTEPKRGGLETGFRGTLDLFTAHPEATALFVMAEQVAVGAMHALHQLNLSIPEQVSLITCDDTPDIKYFNPPLTVMSIPNKKFGYAAAQWVHEMITNPSAHNPPCEPWMRGELIVRESTAPPPSPSFAVRR